MKRLTPPTRLIWLLASPVAVVVASEPGNTPPPEAVAGNGFSIGWYSIDSGSPQASESARYAVRGAIGQADVGNLSGGVYSIDGGYWSAGGALALGVRIFADGFDAAETAAGEVDASPQQ
jgi:hypothetical protein